MPRFFFHFSGLGDDGLDDIGCELDSLEVAFLEAHRGMIDIGAEMLLAHDNPSALAVEIVAESGESLMRLTYDEVLRRPTDRPSCGNDKPCPDLLARLQMQMESSRRLSAEVACAFEAVKATLANTRLMIGLAAARAEASQQLGW